MLEIYLPCHCDLFRAFITYRTILCIRVIEYDRYWCFGNSSLALLIYQVLKVSCSHLRDANCCQFHYLTEDDIFECTSDHLWEICNSQNKAYRIQDVALSGSIQACDCIELRIEAWNDCPFGITFKSVDDDLMDMHLRWQCLITARCGSRENVGV